MNAHSRRSILSRRNVAPCTLLLLIVGIVVCGFAAGTTQSFAQASGGNGRGNQNPHPFAHQPIEDIKKDFNDDDLKVKEQKLRGKWGYGLEFDKDQLNDASVPVAVEAVQSLSGGGKYAGVVKIKRLKIKNRSPKAVTSVQLRWKITSFDDPSKVLLEGTTPFVNFWAGADSSQVVEIQTIHPSLLFKPLAKDGELDGQFKLTIGVQEAYFADGTFWRRQEPGGLLESLYFDHPLADRFPSLASLAPGISPPLVVSSSNRDDTSPCTAEVNRPAARPPRVDTEPGRA